MAPPRRGAYILISGQGLVLGQSHDWVFPRGHRRRRPRQTKPCKTLAGAPSRCHLMRLPSSQINVISTNGDEISHTRDPFRRPDCHPPHQRWEENTEIIKSSSGGSMAAHTNSASATFRDVYLRPCSAPSANNDRHLERTAAPLSLLRIIVSFTQHSIFKRGLVVALSIFNTFNLLGYYQQ